MPRPARPPVPKRPERELRNAILALLRAHGIAAWPTGVGAFPASYNGRQRFVRVGTPGMSDIVGIVPLCGKCLTFTTTERCPRDQTLYRHGEFLAIEVKSPTGRIRPEQTAFLAEVVRHGGIGFVARSCDEVVDKLGLKR